MIVKGPRVAIIGNGGGGKSTLARGLATALGLPLIEVDTIQFGPGYARVPVDEVAVTLDAAAAGERWVIDGFGPWEVIERRMAVADDVVFVDLPLWVHFWLAAERQIAAHVAAAKGEPTSYGERGIPETKLLFATLARVHRDIRPQLIDLMDRLSAEGRARVHRVTSLDALEALQHPAV